jgi:proteasome lid subunit RPN8/RPN11
MRVVLRLPEAIYPELLSHLLPDGGKQEEAAFVFLKPDMAEHGLIMHYIDHQLLRGEDFESQEEDYLELTSDARAGLIKRAHDLNASLAEFHSHPFNWPAEFSLADRAGLRDTVPHMFWRLRNRPYLAVVVAPSGFDALAWVDDPVSPRPLAGLLSGNKVLHPTNRSLGGWDG